MSRDMQFDAPIGLLVNTYPKLSETFIAGEIAGLEQLGLSIRVYSLNQPSDAVFHSGGATPRAPVSYATPPDAAHAWPLVKANLKLLLTSPRRYLKTLAFALRCRDPQSLRRFLQATALVEPLRNDRVAHLHAHFINAPAAVAELLAQLSGLSFSISAHAKDIYLSAPAALRRKLAAARFTVTCSEYNRRHLSALAADPARVHRMYHGIDIGRFHPQGAPPPAPAEQPPVILSVGRLREKKGFEVLIEACRRLRDAGHPVHCKIVGYGPERARLEELIERFALQGVVELLGKLTHDVLLDLYRGATLFALPCQIGEDGDRDGIPNVLLEAMAMCLPVISTTVSGIPEVIRHRDNGLLVPPRDAQALARAIVSLLTLPAEARRMGVAARETVRRMFCNEINLTRLRELLLESPQPGLATAAAVAVAGQLYE